MDYCSCCDKSNDELHKCEQCGQDTCINCLVEPQAPPNPIIDFNLCKTCFELD